jgi:hypothetical protein
VEAIPQVKVFLEEMVLEVMELEEAAAVLDLLVQMELSALLQM